ncbi:TPA: sigma-70 family RNA polymerase sigma factor [Streptococcus suis]|nr:sigma-70 family RNA polymerase sigma factor [Streptococcus suis]HEM5208023.1 sigma-70 family RNA polymerase sigma factor [Streptococcus suis]
MKEMIKRLKNLKTIDVEIMSKRQEIVSLRSKTLKSPQYSTMPKGQKNGNAIEGLNAQIIDDIAKINKEIETLYQERQVLTQAINKLEDSMERNVVRLHYLNNYSWKDISKELNWSERQLQRIRENAVQKLEKLVAL